MENRIPLIQFKNIVMSFDDQLVLKDVSLDIMENEFVTLLGPSGCGKTTLLRILGGFLEPTEGKVVAPADGEVSTLFDTHHAIGLTLDNGMEMLIHVGINTVELNGEGYEAHVSEGDKVVRGQTLITFDIPLIKSKGFPVITPVIITNPDDYTDIHKAADGDVGYLDKLIETAKQ